MKRFAVIGAGNFGCYLAKALYEAKNEVRSVPKELKVIKVDHPDFKDEIEEDEEEIIDDIDD